MRIVRKVPRWLSWSLGLVGLLYGMLYGVSYVLSEAERAEEEADAEYYHGLVIPERA